MIKEETVPQSNTAKTVSESPKKNKEKYTLIWNDSLNFLAKNVRKITFDTWISKLKLIDLQDDIAVIEVKNDFTKNFIEQSYIKLIQEAIKETTAKSYAIRLEIKAQSDDHIELPETIESPNSITEQKSIASFDTNNIPSKNKTKLNEKISLEKTYLGEFNKTCFAFAKSLLVDQTGIYKSLFIYSASGLGKSHFLNLIGNQKLDSNSNFKVKYLNSETFINELIMSIQKNRMQSFRDKYRDLDLLLFDDVQFLENKKTCQEEFIHTYESITKNGGKVVISSNKKTSELKNINPKLISILKSSLVASIEEPQNEDKNNLIDFKVKELKIKLSENHKNMLYRLEGDCIRELEGSLLQVSALQKFSGLEMDNEEFSKVFECSFSPSSRGLAIEAIIKATAEYFYISVEDLTGKRRKEEFTKARHVAIYLSYKLLGLSYKKIGSFFSDRKHSSIIHSIKTIETCLETKLPSSKFTQKALAEIKANLA